MSSDRVLPTGQAADLPEFTIFSDGTELPGTANVISVLVDKTVNKIPLARVVFKDGDASSESFQLSGGEQLVPGKEIEITAGYHNDMGTIFKGVIVKQSIRVKSAGNADLVIDCKDTAYRMTISRKNKYFSNVTDGDAIEELIGAHNLEKDVEATDVQHLELVQYNTSDWDFIVSRSELNGKLVIVDDGKVTVKKPDFSQEPVVTLTYGANILNFDATLDATHQHGTVNCSAWNHASQEMVENEAAAPDVEEAGNLASGSLSGLVSDSTSSSRHTGNIPTEELQAWADALKLKNVLSRIRGVVTCTGLPQVKPGNIIQLDGFGDRFSGKVYVSGVRHQLNDGSWEMDTQFGLRPELFTKEQDVTETAAAGLLPAVNGLQIGIVSQLQDDPDGEHRVLVKMPVVDPEAEGTWARVASLDAGENRGAFFRPEIGDEVVLGFLDDDPRDAVILGMLNSSSKPAPVTASDDNHEKGFYTRDELKLVFNDDLKSIRCETPSGNVLQLSEDEGAILIEDENGNKVELNSEGIAIESAGDITIKANGDIKMEGANIEASANSSLSLRGSSGAEFSSSGTTDVRGTMVNIN